MFVTSPLIITILQIYRFTSEIIKDFGKFALWVSCDDALNKNDIYIFLQNAAKVRKDKTSSYSRLMQEVLPFWRLHRK